MLIQRTKLVAKPIVKAITRTRPTPQAVQAQEVKPAATPVRVLRVTTTNNAAERAAKTGEARATIDHYLAIVRENDRKIDEAVQSSASIYEAIEKIMRENNMTAHTNGVYETEIKEQFSRQGRTVDPKKFKANVASEDFWKAIKVSLEAAKTLMTEKELNAISDIVPATSMGHIFKIRTVEKKRK